MNAFKKNIITIYKEKGKVWLNSLPEQITKLSVAWNLTHLNPIPNLSYNYILSGFQRSKPIILKLSLDPLALDQEATALNIFSNFGAIQILERKNNALLLERAMPGNPLKGHPKAIEIACNVAKKLHKAPKPNENQFPHIRDWLTTLDKEWNIPADHLKKAKEFKINCCLLCTLLYYFMEIYIKTTFFQTARNG